MAPANANPELLYLDLLKRCLTRTLFPDSSIAAGFEPHPAEFDAALRADGRDWPSEAETMVGMLRLDNIQSCATEVIRRGISGDFIETGVWRGGAAILMRGVLAAYGDRERRVWLADSFQGLPRPDAHRYPVDAGDRHWELATYLAVSLEEVKRNFGRYGLLDEQVHFLPGWFKDTLPTAPIGAIALLRIDGDMYESTFQALSALYSKVSPGGFVIVDDYGALPNCKRAVHDFRDAFGAREEIRAIDWTGVYWQKIR
jgi:O-methyltransferase